MQTTRKLLIILMLFMMIFCISGVSASDNADNLTVPQDNIMPSADEAVISSVDDDVISSVDEEVVSSADEDIVNVDYIEFEDESYVIAVSDNYLEGESGLFGFGYYYNSGNMTYIIDNESVYNSTSFPYDHCYHTGGNFINIDDLNLSYGQHQYKIAFDKGLYYHVTFTGTFNYDYIRINVPDNILYVDEYGNSYNQYIQIVLSPLATGNIEVIFNNKTFYSNVINDTNITIDLNNLSPGTYDYQVIYSQGNHDDFIQTGMIKKEYSFEINNRTDDLMNETIFEFVLPADANSVVTVGLGNETYVANITSGFGKITFNNSDILNERFVTFSYEDEKYPLKAIEMDLKDYSFGVDNKIDNIRYETIFEFVLPADANSVVTVGLGNETYAVNLTSGRGEITFNNSEILNESIISFSYEDENHPSKKIEIDLTQLNILTLSTDKRMGHITYNLVSSSFYFEGESKILGIEPKDNYKLSYDTNGKVKYVIVDKRFDSIGDVIILIDGEEFYRSSLDDYYLYQEVVGYNYDGTPIYETIEESGGNFLYIDNLGLSYGEHEYQIIYTGNDFYRGFIINRTFNYDYIGVDCPMELHPPIDYYEYAFTSTCGIKLHFSPLLTGNIEVLFDNESYLNKTITSSEMYVGFNNENGLFDILDVGTHECRIIYSGGNHDDRIINTTFLLDYGYPFNINYEIDNSVNYETSFYFDINDMTRLENGVVTIDLGNKSYRVNLTSDPKNPLFIGNITLSNSEILAADSIIFSVKSPEYPLKKIKMNTGQLNLSVKPQPVLTAKAVTKTYGTSNKLVVYLKDTNGNAIPNVNVNVVLNGASKNIKTDSKGKATLALNQAPGKYNAKITYSGAKEITAKIVVKKATPKITAKAKTFKKSVKTKKYRITLKNNKNQVMKKTKVKLTVNKKTYYATTNSKGVATFKITKLTKKGKYTATVKYGGNKYYNSKTAKPKITIK